MAADHVGAAIDSPVQPLLAIAGVSKSFGGVRAVENVTVSIRRGENSPFIFQVLCFVELKFDIEIQYDWLELVLVADSH